MQSHQSSNIDLILFDSKGCVPHFLQNGVKVNQVGLLLILYIHEYKVRIDHKDRFFMWKRRGKQGCDLNYYFKIHTRVLTSQAETVYSSWPQAKRQGIQIRTDAPAAPGPAQELLAKQMMPRLLDTHKAKSQQITAVFRNTKLWMENELPVRVSTLGPNTWIHTENCVGWAHLELL